jgi:hypothetical protein
VILNAKRLFPVFSLVLVEHVVLTRHARPLLLQLPINATKLLALITQNVRVAFALTNNAEERMKT